MTDTTNTTDTRPPSPSRPPPPDVPEGKKAVWVPERTNKFGTVLPAHWRVIERYRKAARERNDAIRGRALAGVAGTGKKRGPKPGQPRMTSPAHAEYLRGRLDLPITYFTTLRHAMPHDREIDQLLGECHGILKLVQLFVSRFTTNKDMSDD